MGETGQAPLHKGTKQVLMLLNLYPLTVNLIPYQAFSIDSQKLAVLFL